MAHSAPAHSMSTSHHVAAAELAETTAHSHAGSELGQLLGSQDRAGLQLKLDRLIFHLILKGSELFFFIQNGLGISLGIPPERLELKPFGEHAPS